MIEIKNKTQLSDFFSHQHQLELNDLFSPPIQMTRYNIDHYSDALYNAFKIHLPLQAKLWSVKRKAEFLAGRLAAREALQEIGLSKANTPVPIGSNREPIWPQNILGSISHSENFSIATVMYNHHNSRLGVGLDIQAFLDDEKSDLIKQSILTVRDQELLLNDRSGLNHNQLLTLIFSAKESFFKAAYKNVGHYFDFDSVSVIKLDVEYQQMTLVCETNLSDEIENGREYPIFCDILQMGVPTVLTYSLV